MQKETLVVRGNITFINQGIELLSSLTDEQYSKNNGEYYKSGIGRHFRHIIEHYQSLINGYTNEVNYDDRQRDLKIEKDRRTAIQHMREIIDSLEYFQKEASLIDREVKVKSNEGVDDKDAPWSGSSVRRELQFLISHTVHHYALIALILKTEGFTPDEGFGVAPSTLNFENERSKKIEVS